MYSEVSPPSLLTLPSIEDIDAEIERRRVAALSLAEREAEKAALGKQAVEARTNFLKFVTFVRRHYVVNWHHALIAGYLDDFVNGIIPRLLIMTPPRHGKSEEVSRCLPAYIFGRHPDAAVIGTSYGADLAQSMNRDVQRIIDSDRYQLVFPNTRLGSANIRTLSGTWLRNSDEFEIVDHRGAYRCAGTGGGITGKGASYAIIDDPIKNQEEADSPTYREKVWEWYTSTLYTRLENFPQGILLTLTRWHEDDLAGRVLARAAADKEADQWTVVKLEAVKEGPPTTDDPRQEGEALWPDRFPRKRLDKIRASTSERVWSSLFQQRPAPQEGGILKRFWWRFWYPRGMATPPPIELVRLVDGSFHESIQRELPENLYQHTQSWDMAFKDIKSSDYVAGTLWATAGADSYLLDELWDKMDFPSTLSAVRAFTHKWPMALGKLVEDKANGTAVIATLQSEIPGMIAVEPRGGKQARANACSPAIKSGNVYLPHPALCPWVRDFLSECAAFPNGAHDDQVDSMTQYLCHRYGVGTDVLQALSQY